MILVWFVNLDEGGYLVFIGEYCLRNIFMSWFFLVNVFVIIFVYLVVIFGVFLGDVGEGEFVVVFSFLSDVSV